MLLFHVIRTMKCYVPVLLNVLYIVSIIITSSKGEIYTALVDLEPLIHTEGEVVKIIDRYIESERKRLQDLRRLKRDYENLYAAAKDNLKNFLSSPINAFRLVKSLTADWEAANNLIEGENSKAVIDNILLENQLVFPEHEDLMGAASALLRLQDVYLLNATKLARGEIAGAARYQELSAGDCFEIAAQAESEGELHYNVVWLKEALARYVEEEFKTISQSVLLEQLAYGLHKLGNTQQAVKLMQDLVKIDPEYPNVNQLLAYYQLQFLSSNYVEMGNMLGLKSNLVELPTEEDSHLDVGMTTKRPKEEEDIIYEKLCRGERVTSIFKENELHCRYITNNNSYLLLQPVKQEIVSFDPWIVIYHDVISDKDVEIIKRLSQPRLLRATVLDDDTSEFSDIAPFRVGKSGWLYHSDHPRVAHASRMIQEITNLATDTAEDLQIVNYGIGGHYEPHFDFRNVDTFERSKEFKKWVFKEAESKEEADRYEYLPTGNRMATWIYYLSDVEAGGKTVFPEIGVHMNPKKGSAGFWFNLFKSGEGDLRTRHGGCPVLLGSKWVANKWIHELNQEVRRPCGLQQWE